MRVRSLAAAALLGQVSCRCDSETPLLGPPSNAHYEEWPILVNAAARGDLAEARKAAQRLSGGELVDASQNPAAESRIGAVLGFIVAAADDDELLDGVIEAGAACGSCHSDAHAMPVSPRPAWVHETAAEWAVWGLVWADDTPPPRTNDPTLTTLVEAWEASAQLPTNPTKSAKDTGVVVRSPAEERAARVLRACYGCHAASAR